jgi:hypothetical protein
VPRGRFERAQRIQVVGRSHACRKSFSISSPQIISVGGNGVNEHIPSRNNRSVFLNNFKYIGG